MKHLVLENSSYLVYPTGANVSSMVVYIENIVTTFKKHKINLDKKSNVICIWCRGSSGAMLAAMFAYTFKRATVRINHVKKQGEHSHNSSINISPPNCIDIIIDDFMDTGETIFRIWHDSPIKKIDYLILNGVPPSYFRAALLEQKNLVEANYSLYSEDIKCSPRRRLVRPIPKVLITINPIGFINNPDYNIGTIDELQPTYKLSYCHNLL